MRNRWTWIMTAALLAAVTAGCSLGSKQGNSTPATPPAGNGAAQPKPTNLTPTQPSTGNTPTPTPVPGGQPGGAFDLPGSQADLNAALAEPSSLTYQIVLAGDIGTMDKDTYLENLLAERKWPEATMLVLVVYDKANYDIRFAMGSIFNQKQVKVDEILSLVRTHYLTATRAGDPAGAMANLVRAVNARMAQ